MDKKTAENVQRAIRAAVLTVLAAILAIAGLAQLVAYLGWQPTLWQPVGLWLMGVAAVYGWCEYQKRKGSK